MDKKSPGIYQPAEGDFGDWWNPLWVKECRQGMRSHLFETVFTLIHVVMVVVVSFQVMNHLNKVDNSTYQMVFWANLVVVLHVLPLVAAFIKRDEDCRPEMYGLLKMAGMTGDALVFNKYKVHLTQVFLILLSIIPYCLVRYFAGGVNIVDDLVILFWLCIGSIITCAVSLFIGTLGLTARIVTGLIMLFCFPPFEIFLWHTAYTCLERFDSGVIIYFAVWIMFGFIAWMMAMGLASANYECLNQDSNPSL